MSRFDNRANGAGGWTMAKRHVMDAVEAMNGAGEALKGSVTPAEAAERDPDAAGKLEEQKRAKAGQEYDKLLSGVHALNEMADTEAWKRFYNDLIADRTRHEQDILTEEKTRDMVRHQECIKIINGIIKKVQKPIADLNAYCVAMPLFSAEFHTRAQWNAALGTVEFSKSR
jgi:hypothetical protein